MLNIKNHTFLTQEEIKQRANSMFSTKGSTNTSERYSHIPTDKVIEDMALLGWYVTDCKEVKARINRGFQKHLVVFRNNDIVIEGKDGDTVFPSVLLTNSSDGKNAFTLKCAMFRLICENGLVISDQEFSNLRVRHMGYSFEELKKQVLKIVERLPLTVESMNKMKKIQLNEKQISNLAEGALTIRFGKEEMKRITIDYKELIKPIRKEDEGKDLWSVYNLLQEKIINGDFEYKASTKIRKARHIKNFNQDIRINEQLYELAVMYI